jgi:hypothetical protein
MRKLTRTLAGLLILTALGATSGGAAAASLSFSPAGNVTATSLGKVTYESNVFGLGLECRWELTGTLRTGAITKVEGAQIGTFTRLAITECTSFSFSTGLTTSAAIRYASIAGTLPEAITATLVRIEGIAFLVEVPAVNSRCLYIATIGASTPTTRIGAGTYTTGLLTVLSGDQSYTRITSLNSNACPESPTLFGTFRMTTQTITRT